MAELLDTYSVVLGCEAEPPPPPPVPIEQLAPLIGIAVTVVMLGVMMGMMEEGGM